MKEPADGTAGPCLMSCQRSRESGQVPADWKLASVIPVYKKGVREDQGTTELLVQPQFLENYGEDHTEYN